MRRLSVFGAAALAFLLVDSRGRAADVDGAAILRLLGPHAGPALAPATGQVGALVLLPAGQTAASLGLDPAAPGIGRLRAEPSVVLAFADAHPDLHLEVMPPMRMMLDKARLWTHLFEATTSSTYKNFLGQGVAVGVVDTGIDVTLPDFRDPVTKKSRVAWYLDLSMAPLGLHPDLEQKYGLKDATGTVVQGAVLSGADIDARIAAALAVPVDEVGHGTHVTSIAAGNGGGSQYGGFAPEAALITGRATRVPSAQFEDADILTCTQFIYDQADAATMPVVVNYSLGSDFGPHDGTTLGEQVMASYVGAAHPGHALVVAAGNSGEVIGAPIHQSVYVTSGPGMRVPIDTQGASNGTVQVWVTEHAGATLSIGLDGPDGTWIGGVADGQSVGKNTSAYNAGIIHGSGATGSAVPKGSRGATVVWSGKWPTGTYWITLSGQGSADLYLDAGGDANIDGPTPAHFAFGIREGTVGLPATHPDLIAVGATVNRSNWTSIAGVSVGVGVPVLDATGRQLAQTKSVEPNPGDVAWFSGAGPTATGVPKPDIMAPGGLVIAALSQQALPGVATSVFTTRCPSSEPDGRCLQVDPRHAMSYGTSMAAPMAAGTIALLLGRDHTLTQDVLRALLQAGAHPIRGAAPFYDQAGPGELDVLGSLAAQDEMQNPSTVLPVAASGPLSSNSSWMTLSADFATADGSVPLRALLELRSQDGHRANLFELSRLVPVALVGGRPIDSAPQMTRGAAPGVFFFDVTIPQGLGGESLTVGATFDGAPIVAAVTIPISTDAWSSSYASSAKGACQTAPLGDSGSKGWVIVPLLAASVAFGRRRKLRATERS